MAHLFELNTAQQQVDRCRSPHIGLGQRLVADHRHPYRVRLRRRVAFTFDVARRHRTLFHFGHRLAGLAVEHKDHALLAGLHQHRGGAALAVRQIVQQRLRRQVKVPQIVVCGLEVPAHLAGGGIHGHDRGAVFIVQRGTFAAKEIWRGVAGGQIDQIQLRVVGHRRPDVWRTARVGLAFRRNTGQRWIARIPRPCQFAGVDIKRADHARRFASGVVIRDAAAHHHHIARHQRGGGLLIVTRFHFTHADAEVDNTAIAEVFAQFAGIGINGDQAGVDGRQEQTTGTGGRLRACRWRGLRLAIFVIA